MKPHKKIGQDQARLRTCKQCDKTFHDLERNYGDNKEFCSDECEKEYNSTTQLTGQAREKAIQDSKKAKEKVKRFLE